MKDFFSRRSKVFWIFSADEFFRSRLGQTCASCLLVFLFLLTRLCLIFYFPDTVCDTRDQQFGATAVELLHHTKIPVFDLTSDECIGRPFFSYLLIPFYLFFGKAIFWNKVLSLLISLALLMAWHRFLRVYFSSKLAFFFGLLFIFSPTMLTGSNLVLWPSRLQQGGLFVITSVAIFFDMIFNERQGPWRPCFLGIICGLGIWFDYFFVLFLLPLLFFWVLRDKGMLHGNNFRYFSLFFGIGILPCVLFSLRPEILSDHITDTFRAVAQGDPFSRFWEILTVHFQYLFYYQGSFDWTKTAYYFVFLVSLFFSVYIHRGSVKDLFTGKLFCPGKISPEIRGKIVYFFFLFCMAVYVLFSSFSGLRLRPRYLELLYPFIFFVMAMAMVNTSGARKCFYFLLLPCLIFLFCQDVVARWPYFYPGKALNYSGSYDYQYFGKSLFERHYSIDVMKHLLDDDQERTIGIANGFLEQHAGRNIPGLYSSFIKAGILDKYSRLCVRQKFPDYVYLYVRKHKDDGNAVMDAVVNNFLASKTSSRSFKKYAWKEFIHDTSLTIELDDDEMKIVYQCWGVIQGLCYSELSADDPAWGVRIPYMRYFWEGFGYGFVTRIGFNKDIPVSRDNIRDIFSAFEALFAGPLKKLPEKFKGYIYYGAVQNPLRFDVYQLSLQFYMPFLDPQSLIDHIEHETRPFFRPFLYAGMGKGLGVRVCAREALRDSAEPFVNQMNPVYRSFFYSGLHEGLACDAQEDY